jgi:two-component sensor histidine kinase
LRKTEYKMLLWGIMHRYIGYLNNKEEFKKIILYADSIEYYGQNNSEALATSKTSKAYAYYGLKNYKKALECVNETIEYDKGNDYLLCDDYKLKGKIFYDMGDLNQALTEFEKVFRILPYNGQKLIKKELLEYYLNAKLKKENPSLFDKFSEYVEIKDSIYQQSNIDQLAEFDVKYQTVQKDVVIKETKAKNKMYLIAGILTSISSLILAILFYKIRKQRSQIEVQKQEILHNNRNNIQLLISIFGRQVGEHGDNIVAKENQDRLITLNILNRLLYENQSENQANLSTYLNKVTEAKTISCKVPIDIKFNQKELVLDSSLLKDVGLIINELTSNSAKHAFADTPDPKISIDINSKDNNLEILYRDNGSGLPKDFNKDKQTKSFGIEFIKDLVEQHHGTITAKNDGGACFILN